MTRREILLRTIGAALVPLLPPRKFKRFINVTWYSVEPPIQFRTSMVSEHIYAALSARNGATYFGTSGSSTQSGRCT